MRAWGLTWLAGTCSNSVRVRPRRRGRASRAKAQTPPRYRRHDQERGEGVTRDGDATHVAALHGLGLLVHQQGDNAAAAELLGRCVALDPFSADYQFEYGVV